METVTVTEGVNIGEGEVTLDFTLMRDDPEHWYYIIYNFMIFFLRVENILIQFL